MKFQKFFAREILDSRGNPTLEVDVKVSGKTYRAAVPSGASTGTHEAQELRDGGKRYHGKGVLTSVRNVARLGKTASRKSFRTLSDVDRFLLKADGTPTKKRLGANTLLGISLASARALCDEKPLYEYLAAQAGTKPALPFPFANVLNGGKHAGTPLKVQEFMVAPVGAKTFSEAARMVSETYQSLKKDAVKRFGPAAGNVGDEGGIAPPLKNTREALDLVWRAVEENGYESSMKLALDCAASEFYEGPVYFLDGKYLTAHELTDFYLDLASAYPIVSIEDPFSEEAFGDFAKLSRLFRGKAQVVGDDLLVTNPQRIRAHPNSVSALLLKVNQIGTLSESIDAAALARSFGWNVMVSHRSGETEDPFIADLAVGLGCGQIKLGAPCRGERTAKFNQLLRIEEDGVKMATFSVPK
ncbi:MAG TPA: phosphopyruvate hydratase [Candidatus Norongarragalinales archaeon]|nr:phosphopyruvate hydratase [Candidatus Norongarragalinales archaeon]